MRKQPQIEEGMKVVIRDELALYPLISVQEMRNRLYRNGYRTMNGTLDWHYVSKLMTKVRHENLMRLKRSDRFVRLVAMMERHRALTNKLTDIVEGKPLLGLHKPIYPSQSDRVKAANTIMKWDMAMFFAEEAVKRENGPLEGLFKTDSAVNTTEKPELLTSAVGLKKTTKTKKWARFMSGILVE